MRRFDCIKALLFWLSSQKNVNLIDSILHVWALSSAFKKIEKLEGDQGRTGPSDPSGDARVVGRIGAHPGCRWCDTWPCDLSTSRTACSGLWLGPMHQFVESTSLIGLCDISEIRERRIASSILVICRSVMHSSDAKNGSRGRVPLSEEVKDSASEWARWIVKNPI